MTRPAPALALGIAAATLVAPAAFASHIQSTTLGAGRSGTIRTDSPIPLGEGDWSAGLRYEITAYDRISEQQLLDLRVQEPEASLHSIRDLMSAAVDAGYGVTRDVTVGIHVPYVVRSDIREAGAYDGVNPPEVEHLGDSSGIGDLSVYGLWRFWHDGPRDFDAGLIAGVKMPSGRTDVVSDTGEKLETEFQPGSGSWDPFFGVAVSRSIGAFTFAANTSYQVATDGSQQTNLGDTWSYNAGVVYRIPASPGGAHFGAALELNGGWKEHERVAGVQDPNSGGSWLYVSPGLTAGLGSWSAAASVGIGVDRTLNGAQDKLDYQVMVGLYYAPH